MNGNSLLLDTNIVFYLLSGDHTLADLLFNKKLYISFITQLELLGFPDITDPEKLKIAAFLEDCIIVDINNQIKEEVISIKQSKRIKLPDGIILATSIYLGVPLITADSGFNKFEEADIVYYEKS